MKWGTQSFANILFNLQRVITSDVDGRFMILNNTSDHNEDVQSFRQVHVHAIDRWHRSGRPSKVSDKVREIVEQQISLVFTHTDLCIQSVA